VSRGSSSCPGEESEGLGPPGDSRGGGANPFGSRYDVRWPEGQNKRELATLLDPTRAGLVPAVISTTIEDICTFGKHTLNHGCNEQPPQKPTPPGNKPSLNLLSLPHVH
jgi:hypothetical protein